MEMLKSLTRNSLNQGKSPSNKTDTLHFLIVDNHPLTCKAYTLLTKAAFENGVLPKVKLTVMHSCKEVYDVMMSNTSKHFDLVFLDIRLPNYPEKNIFNGEDIGKLVRRYWKSSKILVVTGLTNQYRLHTILNSLNPDGLILKSETCDKNLIHAIQQVIADVPFYSPTVLKIIKNQFIRNNEVSLQERKFLHLLSTGVPSKDIPNYLPWSSSKVEKQKRILKEKLGVEEKSSWGLIHQAKELGII